MANGLTYDVSVYIAGVNKKLRRLEKKFEEQGYLSTRDAGRLGKQYARKIAPFYSGATFRNIVLLRGEGAESIVMARNPTANDGHIRKIGNFNLVRWMHTSPNARRHIRSGDPKFMYSTADYLRKKFPNIVQQGIQKIIAQEN